MKLEDYARSGRYLKWSETNIHHIALAITDDEFRSIEPTFSDRHESDQYEIPVFVIDPDVDVYESVLATKSKYLLVALLNEWHERDDIVLRVHKEGTGFYTKWSVTPTKLYYDKVSGKTKNLPAKKK